MKLTLLILAFGFYLLTTATANAQETQLKLLTDPQNAFRPIALNAATLTTEPLSFTTPSNLSADKRTRSSLFATGITNATTITMQDRSARQEQVLIESKYEVPGMIGVWQLIVLSPANLDGPLTVWLSDNGTESNRAVIAFEAASPTVNTPATIIFAGNSLTAGYDTQFLLPAEQVYPSKLCAEMKRQGYDLTCHNKGIGGITTTEMLQRAASDVDPLINDHSIVVVWELGNDLMFTTSTEQQLFDHIATYCAGRRALGAKVVVVTVPYRFDIARDPVKAAMLERLNARLVSEYKDFADVLVDLNADARLPTLLQPDKVHYLPEGYTAIAESVLPSVRALIQ
jgi:lysophospholipase L1-like esterase